MIDHFVNNPPENGVCALVFSGDLVLDVEGAEHWLSGVAPALRRADVAIGHLEVPHTTHRHELKGDIPAPGADPENLAAIKEAGFTAVSLAGNHMADCGEIGISDTIFALDRLEIARTGAGPNLAAARRPAFIEARGRRIALLSYNCIGPEQGWAREDRAGCAYLPIEREDGGPLTPLSRFTMPAKESRDILEEDIAAIRKDADLIVVAMHKGLVHTPIKLENYERPIAHAAIDAGADIVVGHHAHIVKGIEIYRGRPIFHGLGNGCVVTRALSAEQDHAGRAEWARRRKELFGFEPDPAYTYAPFHPEAVNAMLAHIALRRDGSLEVGVIPVYVEAPGRPVIADETRSVAIKTYIEKITREAGLPALSLAKRDHVWVVS